MNTLDNPLGRMGEWYSQALDVLATPPMAARNADLLRRSTAALARNILNEATLVNGQGLCNLLGVPALSEVLASETVVRTIAPNGRDVPTWQEQRADKKVIICTNCPIRQTCSERVVGLR